MPELKIGPESGPFTEALTQPAFVNRQQFTGLEGNVGKIAGIASHFLEGFARGGALKSMREHQERAEQYQRFSQWGQAVMSNPNIPEDKKAEFQQGFLEVLGHEATNATKEGGKNHPILSGIHGVLTRMTGGDPKGVKKLDKNAIQNFQAKYADITTNPAFNNDTYIKGALDGIQQTAKDMEQKLGRAPVFEEISQTPEWTKATEYIRKHGGKQADNILKEVKGRFQVGPKAGSNEERAFKAKDSMRAEQSQAAGMIGVRREPPRARQAMLSPAQLEYSDAQGMWDKPEELHVGDSAKSEMLRFNRGGEGIPAGYYRTNAEGQQERVLQPVTKTAKPVGELKEDKDGNWVRIGADNKATPIMLGDQPLKGKEKIGPVIKGEGGFFRVGDDGKATPITDSSGKAIKAPARGTTPKDLRVQYSNAIIGVEHHYGTEIFRLETDRRRRIESIETAANSSATGNQKPMDEKEKKRRIDEVNKSVDEQKAPYEEKMKAEKASISKIYGIKDAEEKKPAADDAPVWKPSDVDGFRKKNK